jgi:restriction system protein
MAGEKMSAERTVAVRGERRRITEGELCADDPRRRRVVDVAHSEQQERVRRLKTEAAQLTADVANRVALLTHVLDDRERAVHHHRLTLGRAFAALGADGLARLAATLLADLARYPAEAVDPVLAAYSVATGELLLRVDLPRLQAVPKESGYRYLPSRGDIVADPRKPEDVRALYRDLAVRFVLRTLDHAFAVTPPDLVGAIVLDGHVRATDPATDLPVHPCLASVRVTRDVFEDVDLDRVDPLVCLASFSALMSSRPYDLEPVRTRLDFDAEVAAHGEEPDVLGALGDRPDLLALTAAEFERLVRVLLETMCYRAWVTRAAYADGVDAVAVAPDAGTGVRAGAGAVVGSGLCVVRVRQTAKVVPIATVRALRASMAELDAGRGILVTTSWFSNADQECARRDGRIRLVDGSALRRLLAEHLGLDAVVGLPRLPAGWRPGDIG